MRSPIRQADAEVYVLYAVKFFARPGCFWVFHKAKELTFYVYCDIILLRRAALRLIHYRQQVYAWGDFFVSDDVFSGETDI